MGGGGQTWGWTSLEIFQGMEIWEKSWEQG